MKKLLLICAMVVCGIGQVHAQLEEDDFGFFNHVALGVSAGTDGIGVQLAAPLTSSFAVRAGYSFMPKFKYKKDINVGKDPAFLSYPNDQHVDLEGKLNMSDFSLLFDYYPSMYSSFRLTAGAYIGKSDIVTVSNKITLSPDNADVLFCLSKANEKDGYQQLMRFMSEPDSLCGQIDSLL